MINKNLLIYTLFLLISILFVIILFFRIPPNNFLFIGDQFFRFSKEETFANAFYIRKMLDFSVFNAWQLTVQTPDILFYSFVYKLGFSMVWAEKILFTVIGFMTLALSYIGFTKLSKLYLNKVNISIIIAITSWYAINPYLMVLWHGAVYNFGSAITYSLSPLILYFFHQSIVNVKALKVRIICALLMFLASFTFWMFAALGIFLFIYTISLAVIYKKALGQLVLNIGKLLAIYIPMIAMIIYPIMHEYMNNAGDVNGTFIATFGQIKGGLLYQLLMWFSWGIYNNWTPRSIYPELITNFYFSPIYIGATASLYLLLGFHLYKRLKASKWNQTSFIKSNYVLLTFLTIFFISIFLAKGQEPPFGGIFLFLYEHVPFFTVFRSSDHRFGFPAVLSLALALLIVTKSIKNKKSFALILIGITIVQNFIFFTGDLLIGQNLENKYIDRVVSIPTPYQELSNYLNAQNDTFYILPNPSLTYGTFKYDQNDKHIGQDMLPKLINKPFADVPVVSGMSMQTGRVLYTSVQQDLPEMLTLLPIKYILERKDVECDQCMVFSEAKILESSEKEYENSLFTLYKLKNYTPLIFSNSNITYRKINPVRYEIELKNVKEDTALYFMESYNSNWKAYALPYEEVNCDQPKSINENTTECKMQTNLITFSDLKITSNTEIKTRIFPQNLTHINAWSISPEIIARNKASNLYQKNADGTYNLKIAIFYAPQSQYIYSIFISLISVLVSVIVLFYPATLMRKFRKE